MPFSESLQIAMNKFGITAYGLSQKTGISADAIGKWLKGTQPTLDKLMPIADFLEISLDELAGRTPPSHTEQGLTSLLKRVQKRARIDIHGFHSLRRGFAREFIVNGGGMFQLQQLMGHEDISTTQNYVGLDEKDIEQAHRKASPMNRLK